MANTPYYTKAEADAKNASIKSSFSKGVIPFDTFALLPTPGDVNTSYKVTNDSSNNGFYHWNGTSYIKDENLANGEVALDNVDAVSGDKVAKYVGKKTLLNEDLFTDPLLMKPNGILDTYDSGYGIVDYIVTPNTIIDISFNIQTSVNANNFALAALYKDDVWVKDIIISTSETIYYSKVVIPENVNKLRITNKRTLRTENYIYQSSTFIQKDDVVKDINSVVELPNKIYGLNYKSTTINFLNRIYVEGVFTDENINGKINGANSSIIDKVSTTSTPQTVPITLSADGHTSMSKTVVYDHNYHTKGQNKLINWQGIGDSLTDGGYPALVEFISKCYNQDLGSIKVTPIGVKMDNLTIDLGGYSFFNRGANEGRSGWAISDYLRHSILTSAKGTSANGTMRGKVAWDGLGLGTMSINGVPTREYEPYTYSETTGDLIRTTCHTYYDADPTAELWDWIVNMMNVTSFTYDSVLYTFGSSYSAADDDAQKAYILYLAENPWNPFFDMATVQSSSGAYAFNYATYLSRHKTLENDGATRLIVGSTAGTKVTDVNAYDVCEPTHITVIMNENDVNNVERGVGVADDHILMGQLIKSYNTNIKVSLGSVRKYGAFDTGSYNNIGFIEKKGVTTRHLETYVRLRDLINDTYTEFDFIPLYAIQSVFGGDKVKAFDTLDQQPKERFSSDGTHAVNTIGYLDRAYQVISWIWSTL